MNDAKRQRRVRKFVAGRSDSIAQRPANAAPASRGSTCPTRLVNEVTGGKIGLNLASVISAAQVNLHLPDQVFD
jgi:hypothetical protein